MAPYGACEVAQSTTHNNAQFEAERCPKEFQRNNESALEVDTNMPEQRFRMLDGFEAARLDKLGIRSLAGPSEWCPECWLDMRALGH